MADKVVSTVEVKLVGKFNDNDTRTITIDNPKDDDFEKSAADLRQVTVVAQDFTDDLKTCYLLINHDALKDCDVSAFVNFTDNIQRRENFSLGRTTGQSQVFQLPDNFAQDSLIVKVDGVPFTDFYFDTQFRTITLTAPIDLAVTASYDYFTAESWQAMTKDFSNGKQTRFIYTAATGKKVAAARFVFAKKSGHVEGTVGTGTGRLQTFKLEHLPVSLTCTAPYILDGDVLNVVAPAGEGVFVSYNWRGVVPKVHSYIAGYSG